MDTSGLWNSQDPTLSIPSQEDFQQFIDLNMNNMADTLQFDFDFNQQQSQNQQMMHQDGMGSMNVEMIGSHQMGHNGTLQEHMPSTTTASNHSAILGTPIINPHTSTDNMMDFDAQIQYLKQQKRQLQLRQSQEQQRNFYAQSRMVPPTPNSMEIHGVNQHFYTQAEQPPSVYEPYRLRDQEMAFTPLVSPAVTPLETHFNIPDYTAPPVYFSPLSSPALHAQNDHQVIFDHTHSGSTNSPTDMNCDSHSAPASSNLPSRKPTRKSVAPKPRVNNRAVRQSPIVKPNRNRKSTSMNAQALGEIIDFQTSKSKGTGPTNSAASTDHSENGSISPEHLSDMAPPPLPSSAGRSPYVVAQNDNVKNKLLPLDSPATPASLMRIIKSPTATESTLNQEMELDDPALDGFSLPEAATTIRPVLPRIDTQSDGQTTPTLHTIGSQTPGFQPLPSPVIAHPGASSSINQSPQIDAMNGINGAARKTPQTLARGSKKRTSKSVLASPALLPKISPSIKPLLPGGSPLHNDAAASLLLASKSNYQKILEGTHLPGVSYPSELSTNLTLKRTSHKLAEQGRRNRINLAITTLHDMIPSEYYPRGKSKDAVEDKGGSGDAGENEPASSKGGQSSNSKAATVEVAIEYISHLEKVLAEANKRAEEAEQKLVEKEKL
ncbi:hypothetical protein EYC80_005916 [Monilinia laxa]|uniref:BHLH domain-containing protein n=2 Tax=Monilinia laxa TaxID=61186 RepID=A0A5N6KFH3_MONLA|nr:hypothetical protein EYC80_005916 [Monilinia laxa]